LRERYFCIPKAAACCKKNRLFYDARQISFCAFGAVMYAN